MRRLVAIVTVVRVCYFLNFPAPKKRLILNIFLDILCSLFTKIQTVIAFMEEIRWGIIGCGKVTELKSGPAFDEIADSKLSVGDAPDLQQSSRIRPASQRAEMDCRRRRVDRRSGCRCHLYRHASRFSRRLYRQSYCSRKAGLRQKPMARTYAECQRMIDACDRTSVPLCVPYYGRALAGQCGLWIKSFRMGAAGTAFNVLEYLKL